MFTLSDYRCEVCEQAIPITDKAEWVVNGGLLCEHCADRYHKTLYVMAHKDDEGEEAGG